MSAQRLTVAWGALVGASVFTVLAVVAVPRRGGSTRPPAPAVPPNSELAVEQASEPAQQVPVIDSAVQAPSVEREAAPGPVSLARRAPAVVSSVPDTRAALAKLLEGARGLAPLALADAAVGLGPELVPSLLDAILGRGEWPEGEDAATGDLRVLALRDAWGRYEPTLRARALVECAAPTRDERRVLVELAGELGGELALPTVIRLARDFEASELARSFVAEPVERALALALSSSRASERSLESMLAGVTRELAPTLVRGWAQAGDARGPAIAARALGSDAVLDLEILTALAQPSCPARAALGERALTLVRQALGHDDPKLRRCAAAVLGNARDTLAVDPLVDSLDDVDALVRAGARDALRSITGKDLGGDSEGWRGWILERRAWLEVTSAQAMARAQGAECIDAMEALEELLARGDARDELVQPISELRLSADCEAVRERSRIALIEIGSSRALALAQRGEN